MTKHYGRMQILQILGMFALMVLVLSTCCRAECPRMAIDPDGSFFYLDPQIAPSLTITIPEPDMPYSAIGGYMLSEGPGKQGQMEWVEAEYLVVDWDLVDDYNMIYTTESSVNAYYVQPKTKAMVVKHFKTMDEVTKYLDDRHRDDNYQPEVYQAIKVKMKCEVQEDTSWRLQKDVQKTYRWKKEK